MTQFAGGDRPAWSFPSVGRWGLGVLPPGWAFLAGFGIRQVPTDPAQVAGSIGLGEDKLDAPGTLAAYITKQAVLIAGQLSDARIAGPQASSFPGAKEAFLFMVRHSPEGMPEMLHVQTYVSVGLWVGIVTLTTAEAMLRQLRPDYDAFVKGLCILPESSPEQQGRG